MSIPTNPTQQSWLNQWFEFEAQLSASLTNDKCTVQKTSLKPKMLKSLTSPLKESVLSRKNANAKMENMNYFKYQAWQVGHYVLGSTLHFVTHRRVSNHSGHIHRLNVYKLVSYNRNLLNLN